MLVLGFLSRSDAVKRASLVVLLGMALMTIPVYLTGEPAEDRVESVAGISKTMIEEHEGAAKLAFAAMGLSGLVALVVMLISFRFAKYANLGFAASLAVSLFAFGLVARTANLGGQIRHTEIRSATAQNINDSDAKQKTSGKEDDDDK